MSDDIGDLGVFLALMSVFCVITDFLLLGGLLSVLAVLLIVLSIGMKLFNDN